MNHGITCSTPGCDNPTTGNSPDGCTGCQRRADRLRARAAGKCNVCRAMCGKGRCDACRERMNTRRRESQRAKVLVGVCRSCPRPAATHSVRCVRCLRMKKVGRARTKTAF